MYKLILADGTEIPNLEMNGTNFVSETKIDESIFTNNLSTLTIVGDGEETVMHNAYLVQQVTYDWDNRWYLCFSENTPSQLDRIESQVAYTAMMTDTLMEV